MEQPAGFSLVELLVAITLLAVTTGMAVPTLRRIKLDTVRAGEVNQFVQALHFARGEAMKRNDVVSLCPSADADSCAASGVAWHQGWIVFVNRDADSPAVRDAGEDLLRAYPAWREGSIASNRGTLSFRAFGQSGTTATFTFCDARGGPAARAVIISQTGRPRVSSRSASDTALVCP